MDPIIGAIVVALITGGLSLCGQMITTSSSSVKMEGKFDTSLAVTNTKIDTLYQEVRELAEYTKRVPVLETEMLQIKAEVKSIREDVERLKSESHK